MNIYTALGLCFLPSIVCFACFSTVFKVKVPALLFAALFGLIAVLPITFFQFYFSMFFKVHEAVSSRGQLFHLFLKALLFNGLIEEMFKMIFIVLLPTKKIRLKKFFLTVLFFGLVIGSFESAVYMLNYIQSASGKGAVLLYDVIYKRFITSDIIHMSCAGMCGLFIWSIRKRQIDIFAVIFAVLIHGVFDFFVTAGGTSYWLSFVAVLFALIECRVRYVKQTNEDESVAAENETIIVFQQNEDSGEKRKKMDPSIVGISPTKPKDFDGESKVEKKSKKNHDTDKTQEAQLVRKSKKK